MHVDASTLVHLLAGDAQNTKKDCKILYEDILATYGLVAKIKKLKVSKYVFIILSICRCGAYAGYRFILIYCCVTQASLDEPTQSVVMHRTEPSRLQSIALQLSDKVASLVENNERLMEIKQGNFGGFQGKGMSQRCSFLPFGQSINSKVGILMKFPLCFLTLIT